jgi:hypothetical protein
VAASAHEDEHRPRPVDRLIDAGLVGTGLVVIGLAFYAARGVEVEPGSDLATIVGTAIPVVMVALFAMRAAEDPLEFGRSDPRTWIEAPRWFIRCYDRSSVVRWLLRAFGSSTIAEVEESASSDRGQLRALRLSPRFRLAIDQGFIWRSSLGFLLAVCASILDPRTRSAHVCLALAMVLVVWSMNALVTYAAVHSALRFDVERRAHPPSPEPSRWPGTWFGERLQAWRVVLLANVFAIGLLLAALSIASRVAAD